MKPCPVCSQPVFPAKSKGRPRVTCSVGCARKRKTALQRARNHEKWVDGFEVVTPPENAATAVQDVLEAVPATATGQCWAFWNGEQCGNKRLAGIIYCHSCRERLGSLSSGGAAA